MHVIGKLYSWYGKRTVNGVLAVLGILVVTALFISFDEAPEAANAPLKKSVRTASVYELVSGSSLSLIGTVEAVDGSRIESETSGRVTRVNVALGDVVGAGTVIAELENASERAAVLQAEGSYEAALVAAAQSDISVTDARNALSSAENAGSNAYRSAFTVSEDAIRNLVDDFFTDVDDSILSFRIDSQGQALSLIAERRAIEDILDAWYTTVSEDQDPANAEALLLEAKSDTERIANFVDRIAFLASTADPGGSFTREVLDGYKNQFLSARTSLNGTLSSINNSLLAIQNAKEALGRAELGGSATELSSANAQVKQALGSLRAAQANLAKTIIRTPIGGTVNALPVRVGDYIGSFAHIATVANNDALYVTTFVSAVDRDRIAVGETVRIDGRATGTITNIAPAVDPDTKKIEVQIATDSEVLANGDTVRVLIDTNGSIENITDIVIPIAALKVLTDRVVVFTLSPEDRLIAHEVETGPLVGNSIVIESGVTPEMMLVTDARGLNEGDVVAVIE